MFRLLKKRGKERCVALAFRFSSCLGLHGRVCDILDSRKGRFQAVFFFLPCQVDLPSSRFFSVVILQFHILDI